MGQQIGPNDSFIMFTTCQRLFTEKLRSGLNTVNVLHCQNMQCTQKSFREHYTPMVEQVGPDDSKHMFTTLQKYHRNTFQLLFVMILSCGLRVKSDGSAWERGSVDSMLN